MSESTDTAFGDGHRTAVLRLLNDLADLVESDPRTVAQQTAALLPILRDNDVHPAYGWALSLRAQACRFLDDLAGVLEAAAAASATLDDQGRFTAQLHLEAGMALNQFGAQSDALDHLRRSLAAFAQLQDESGESWALVSLAEALAGMGYPEDPFPYLDAAIEKAQRSQDDRARRRAHKQRAVALRHHGKVEDALAAISEALDGQPQGHTRANFQLERGHLLAMGGQYAAADEDYVAADSIYAESGDRLGLANCSRGLAVTALILGRNREGLRHLDAAARAYRELSNETGLAYVLRERALVRLADGDEEGATVDAEEGTELFRRSDDQLGRAGMLRTAARIAHARGDRRSADEFLASASALVADKSNPLAEAGILLMKAEVGSSIDMRLKAARKASDLYERMNVAAGRAHALTLAAQAEADGRDTSAAMASLRDAKATWLQARMQVIEPSRRADHDFALRDVVTNALRIAAAIGGTEADGYAADLVITDAPLGLRRALRTGQIGLRAQMVMRRAQRQSPRPRGTQTARVLLEQLSFALTTLESASDKDIVPFTVFRDQYPSAAVLTIGQPTRDSQLPVAWAVPGARPRFQLSPLVTSQVDAIDALGLALTLERADVLWHPDAREWQKTLVTCFLPLELTDWLAEHRPAALVVTLPPILAHIPLEALLVDEEPLGVMCAVRRVPVVAAGRVEPDLRTVTAYLDPALPWSHERAACSHATSDPGALRANLGECRLVLIGCHGDSAARAEGTLTATDGTPVLDAIDLLAQHLNHSVVILEACFSGRYLGARSGEPLNLATVALLAGASAAIAGLFALPADDATTGLIAAQAFRELQSGVDAPEALRRARSVYWSQHDEFVMMPRPISVGDASMPGDAPWAWAGLCAYGR